MAMGSTIKSAIYATVATVVLVGSVFGQGRQFQFSNLAQIQMDAYNFAMTHGTLEMIIVGGDTVTAIDTLDIMQSYIFSVSVYDVDSNVLNFNDYLFTPSDTLQGNTEASQIVLKRLTVVNGLYELSAVLELRKVGANVHLITEILPDGRRVGRGTHREDPAKFFRGFQPRTEDQIKKRKKEKKPKNK